MPSYGLAHTQFKLEPHRSLATTLLQLPNYLAGWLCQMSGFMWVVATSTMERGIYCVDYTQVSLGIMSGVSE